MSGYGRGMPIQNLQQPDQKKFPVQGGSAQQSFNNYSQPQSQSQYNPNQPQQMIRQGQSAPSAGQRDEWDSYFSQGSPKGIPNQQQQPSQQSNVYQQPQLMQKSHIPVVSSVSNPIDRASQLLRSLNQTSEPTIVPTANYGVGGRAPSANIPFQSGVSDAYSPQPLSTHQQQYHPQQQSAAVVMKPQSNIINPQQQQQQRPQQTTAVNRYGPTGGDYSVSQSQYSAPQLQQQQQQPYNGGGYQQQPPQQSQVDYYESAGNVQLQPQYIPQQQQQQQLQQQPQAIPVARGQLAPQQQQVMYSTQAQAVSAVGGSYNQQPSNSADMQYGASQQYQHSQPQQQLQQQQSRQQVQPLVQQAPIQQQQQTYAQFGPAGAAGVSGNNLYQQQPGIVPSGGVPGPGPGAVQLLHSAPIAVGNSDRYVPIQAYQQQPQQNFSSLHQQQQQVQNILKNVEAFSQPSHSRAATAAGGRTSRFSGSSVDTVSATAGGGGYHQQQQQSANNFSPVNNNKRSLQQQGQGQQLSNNSNSASFNKYPRTDNTSHATGTRTQQQPSSTRYQQQQQQQQQPNSSRIDNRRPNQQQQQQQQVSYGRDRDAVARRSSSNDRGRSHTNNAPKRMIQSATSNATDRRRSRSPSKERKRERTSNASAAGSAGSVKSDTPTTGPQTHRRIDYTKTTLPNMLEFYNIPIVGRHVHALSAPELFSRFPNLYVPADLVRIEMDWNSLFDSLQADTIRNILTTVNAEITNQPAMIVDDSLLCVEPPKFTNVLPSHDQSSSSLVCSSRMTFSAPKPTKFNVRVMITFGMNNSENERIDFNLTKKLRVLIGKRKQNAMLLGGSWCSELDGGDPLQDRSCLVTTARRCVMAQSMVDIGIFCRFVKICEIFYQRPKEEIKGKLYPEQEEVTVVYLCSVQPTVDITAEDFDVLWDHYCSRVDGKEVGPVINQDADTSSSLLFTPPVTPPVTAVVTARVDEVSTSAAESKLDDTPILVDHEETSAVESKTDADDKMELNEDDKKADVDIDSAVAMTNDTCAVVAGSETVNATSSQTAKAEVAQPAHVSTTNTVFTKTHLIKPEKPCMLICPMPISKELASDPMRKLEGVSVKLLTLSQILTYSEDDSNERIFEASITAELLRSLIAIDYADIITDFVMSEYTSLTYCGDPRVSSAVKTLRRMTKRSSAIGKVHDGNRTVATVATVSAPAVAASTQSVEVETEESKESKVDSSAAIVAEVSIDNAETAINDDGEASAESAAVTAAVIADSSEPLEATDSAQPADGDNGVDEPENKEEEHSESAAITAAGAAVAVAVVVAVTEEAADAENEDDYMSEPEAREYRRHFVNACRWFDIEQQRSLRQDHLELILYSSTRDISRAELCAAAWNVCKEEKLRYEIHI